MLKSLGPFAARSVLLPRKAHLAGHRDKRTVSRREEDGGECSGDTEEEVRVFRKNWE